MKNLEIFVQKLKDNDDSAWRYLVDSYSDKLFDYAYSLSKDYENSLDILQHVFLKVFIIRDRLNPNLSIKSYLFKSVLNEHIRDFNKRKNICRFDESYCLHMISSLDNNPEEELAEKIEKMNGLIDGLPRKTKQVFIMSKKRGLSIFEISEKLNIHPKTVEGHITKAFKLLRNRTKLTA